jgi:hypothetical protein
MTTARLSRRGGLFKLIHMKQETSTKQATSKSEFITAIILEHSEDMLILAYTLTHSAVQANKIVEDILLHVLVQNNLVQNPGPLHTYLYALVQEACGQCTFPIK